jgi:hypothetical protein
MPSHTPTLHPAWVREGRAHFRQCLAITTFPPPVRHGTSGSAFDYPAWLIMLIAVLSVQCKMHTDRGMHRLALQSWDVITEEGERKPISESPLRERLKNSCPTPRRPAAFMLQGFPQAIGHSAGQCRQDDGQRHRSRLASKTDKARHPPHRLNRP